LNRSGVSKSLQARTQQSRANFAKIYNVEASVTKTLVDDSTSHLSDHASSARPAISVVSLPSILPTPTAATEHPSLAGYIDTDDLYELHNNFQSLDEYHKDFQNKNTFQQLYLVDLLQSSSLAYSSGYSNGANLSAHQVVALSMAQSELDKASLPRSASPVPHQHQASTEILTSDLDLVRQNQLVSIQAEYDEMYKRILSYSLLQQHQSLLSSLSNLQFSPQLQAIHEKIVEILRPHTHSKNSQDVFGNPLPVDRSASQSTPSDTNPFSNSIMFPAAKNGDLVTNYRDYFNSLLGSFTTSDYTLYEQISFVLRGVSPRAPLPCLLPREFSKRDKLLKQLNGLCLIPSARTRS
jgi:hypothetical protein